MRDAAIALQLSFSLHGLIAAGLVWCIGQVSEPDELVKLELTSVELSFSEKPEEAAEVVPVSAPSSEAPPPKLAETKADLPPERMETAEPSMPEVDTADLPDPDELREEFEPETDASSAVAASSPAPVVPAVAPRQARVDVPPRPRRNIRPEYPSGSRRRGEQGDVTLEIVVNANGTVDGVRVVHTSGYPALDEAATKAVRSARFTPAKASGEDVSATARLTLSFRLR